MGRRRGQLPGEASPVPIGTMQDSASRTWTDSSFCRNAEWLECAGAPSAVAGHSPGHASSSRSALPTSLDSVNLAPLVSKEMTAEAPFASIRRDERHRAVGICSPQTSKQVVSHGTAFRGRHRGIAPPRRRVYALQLNNIPAGLVLITRSSVTPHSAARSQPMYCHSS